MLDKISCKKAGTEHRSKGSDQTIADYSLPTGGDWIEYLLDDALSAFWFCTLDIRPLYPLFGAGVVVREGFSRCGLGLVYAADNSLVLHGSLALLSFNIYIVQLDLLNLF